VAKGRKKMRGVGEIWDETKSVRPNIMLTPTADRILKQKSKEAELSCSEFVERWLRSLDRDRDVNHDNSDNDRDVITDSELTIL
jgi:hypothetical protein